MGARPLKLAVVTRRYPPLIGGAETVLSYLAYALAAHGTDVTVVTSHVPGLDLAAREEVLVKAAECTQPMAAVQVGHLVIMRLPTSRLRFWGTWRYMHNLRHWFEQNPVDLAYVSMLKHDAYVVVGVASRQGFRVVLRPEGAGQSGDLAWQSWGNFGRLIGHRCRHADAFVAISRSIEEELREAWQRGTLRPGRIIRPGERECWWPQIIAIPNGVPVPETMWQCRANWQIAPRAVFVGRLAPEKGLDTLIDAWPLVQATFPEARLTLVGEGPQQATLEEKARVVGLSVGPSRAVELVGAMANPAQVLRDADLFVLPSREEGMSIALLEAMALGIPLVASSIAGNRRLVVDFEHGRLAPVDNPQGLARVIISQWADFDRAIELGRAARSRVAAEFSIDNVARKHLRLFDEVVRHGTVTDS
jgi:glycosyltransferase involved in cell wall biosynthesis